MKSDILDTK